MGVIYEIIHKSTLHVSSSNENQMVIRIRIKMTSSKNDASTKQINKSYYWRSTIEQNTLHDFLTKQSNSSISNGYIVTSHK
jgi:hypothetical protein